MTGYKLRGSETKKIFKAIKKAKKPKKEEEGEGPFATFFIVHLEVGTQGPPLKWQEMYWHTLVNLVNLADKYGMKLTLEFCPQWAEYILKDSYKVDQVRLWHSKGHEIALHHHPYYRLDGTEFLGWDGYTNTPGFESHPKYQGTIEIMMKLMDQLAEAINDKILTACCIENDWPEGVIYKTDGHLISHARIKPRKIRHRDVKVTIVGMGLLDTRRPETLSQLKGEFAKAKKDETFGVVTHEFNFASSPNLVEDWFKFVRETGVKEDTIRNVIQSYNEKMKLV